MDVYLRQPSGREPIVLDLEPATRGLTTVVLGVRDEQLAAPTPCADTNLGALLDHVDGLSLAFTWAATKEVPAGGSPGPSADASRLGPDWRTRIPARLAELARAWHHDAAWEGTTQAGGQDLPGALAGVIALNEIVVHGWDVAVASGQPFAVAAPLAEAALDFVGPTAAQNPGGTPGLFGPPVPVADNAPPLDRLLGLTGRDPEWHA
jgi:uncharacterized protein (TIGR03086 family)